MPTATTRQDAARRIAELFRAHGYDGTSLSRISEATGLGKASLYHHFPGGKEEMGRAVFEVIGVELRALVLQPLRDDGAPADRLRAWASGLLAFYDGGRANCLLGAMLLSGGDQYGDEVKQSFRTLLRTLARTLREAGLDTAEARRRSERAVALVQGALVTARGLDDPRLFRRLVRELPESLLAKNG